jgi:hypothetical protein
MWHDTVPLGAPIQEALRELVGSGGVKRALQEIVLRVDVVPGSEVGRGAHGIVYDAGGGRAVKLTRDRGEIQAMALLRGVEHKNLVRVDDVVVIYGARGGAGVIVRELVGKTLGSLDELDAAAMDLSSLVDRAIEQAEDLTDADVDENELEPYQALSRAMGTLYDELGDAADDYEHGSRDRKALLGVRSAIGKLKNLGIYGVDFPPRNIAIDDLGNAVVFDVGAVDFFGKLRDVKRIDCRV